MTLRYLSLFSGIEAATVAWHPLGWTPVAFAEVDPFASAVLAHHYPHVPNLGDVTKADFDAIKPVDLIVGGSPCQSFSTAGKRLGLDDPRGNLALVMLQIVGRVRPRWLVYENVPGLLSSDGGRDFGAFLATLAELGYGFAYRVLDAQHFGVPQRRRRVFVVGYLGDWRPAAAVLFERESLSGHPAPRRKAGARVAGTLAGVSPSGGWRVGTDEAAANHCVETALAFGGNNTSGPIDIATAVNAHGGPCGRMDFESETFIATTLRARDGSRGVDSDCTDTLIAHTLRSDGFGASEDGTGRGTPLVPVGITLHGTDGTISVASFTDTASALRARIPGCVENSTTTVVLQSAVRRLTPRETERLQGFPDDWTLIPYRGKAAADGPRYKAIGNSFAVPVVRWIGTRIQAVEAILAEREMDGVA